MRWIWIDRFLEFRRGEFARAVKHWSLAEDIFSAHFPQYPVVPATLLLEGLAQTGGILVGEARDYREKVILAKFPKARFHFDAVAGQELIYDATLVQIRDEGAMVDGRITVGARLLAEVEIYFAHLDQSRSQQIFGDRNFVFSGELKQLLNLAQAAAQSQIPPAP
jgi:3-hydroxyacyl-[acyl-carrier-protein] dehydratase